MRNLPERLLTPLAWASALLVPGIFGGLLLFLLRRGLPTLGPDLLFGDTPPLQALFAGAPVFDGLWPACLGTLCLVLLTAALAVPLGLGGGICLAGYMTGRGKAVIGFCVDLLAGIPSILMGLFGFALVLLLRRTIWPASNTGLWLSASCLALLVLPSLVSTTRTCLEGLPAELRLTGAALGLTRWQSISRLLLPAAGPGILGGVILAIGRAAEDTAVILLTGVVANAGAPAGLTEKFEALPFSIYYLAAEYQTPRELNEAFGAALLLLGITAALFACSRRLQRGLERRWRHGPQEKP